MISTKQSYLIRCGFFGILFFIVRFVLNFDGLYGQDAYEYLRYTNEMYSFFTNGTFLGDYFWGLGYPFVGCLFNFFIQDTSMALQLVSLLAALVTCIYIDKIIELIYAEKPNHLLAILFFAISPIVVVQSLLVMSDMLAAAFITVAIFYFSSFLKNSKNTHFILGVIMAVFAFHTRYVSIVILLVLLVVALMKIISEKKYMLLLISLILFIVVSLPHINIRSNASLNFLSNQLFTEWSIFNLSQQNFATDQGVSRNKVINLVYCFYSFFHPQFFGFGLFALIIALFYKFKFFINNRFQNILWGTIVLYALFLGGIPFQNKRFLLISLPLVVIVLYPFLNQVINTKKLRFFSFLIVFVLQASSTIYYGKIFYDRNKLEQVIANDLGGYPGETIYIFEMDLALKARNIKLDYQNLWYKEYSSFNKGALVLVNAPQLEKQWIGKNPLINWNKLKIAGGLQVLKSYGNGWNLYQIQ